MELPRQTAEIFETLRNGQFLSSNGSDRASLLYNIIEGGAFETLKGYFSHIGLTLEAGAEYYYFSRKESKADLERKVEAALKWIDILDFLKTYDGAFGPGMRFTQSDILVKVSVDATLKSKLQNLKKWAAGKETLKDILGKIADLLTDNTFAMLEEPIGGTYKVLHAFNYLEELVLSINIPEDVSDAIPE